MMKKLLLATALLAPTAAFAQTPEAPAAPTSDVPATADTPTANATANPTANTTVEAGTATQNPPPIDEGMGGTDDKPEAEGGHHYVDPSKHFVWFGGPFDHNGKDEFGGKLGDGKMVDPETGEVEHEEEPMSAPFIFMILNFAVLVGILAWKAAPLAGQAARDRHDQIKNALDEAAKLRAEAAAKLASFETKLKDADAEIKAMVEGMRADAEADKKRILENAERQSAQMKRDAELRIAAEIDLARANLTREVTAAATAATEKLLAKNVDHSDQAKLVNAFIADLSAGRVPGQKETR